MVSSKVKNYIKSNWGKKDLATMQKDLNINLYTLLQTALELSLYSIELSETLRARTRWTEEEDNFLKDHSHELSINEACNLLHRSRYATYQRVKFLDLEEMVSKRNTNR